MQIHLESLKTAVEALSQQNCYVDRDLTGNSIMLFGKHKGKPLSEVPDSWYVYMHDRGKLSGAIKQYAEENVPILRFVAEKKKSKDSK